MTTTMPLDTRAIHALQLLSALERLESLDLAEPVEMRFIPGELEKYQVGSHRGQTLAMALERALRELSESAETFED